MNETTRLATRVAAARLADIPHEAQEVSKQALLDFIGVTIAGIDEPLAQILRTDAQDQGGHPQATIIGTSERASVQQAALINGSAGHAHDYDDVQMVMSGHPTVPVAPVVLALAERHQLNGREVLKAFSAGVDAECLVSQLTGPSHYQQGWHATGTLGAFGATAAAAVLMDLDEEQTARALGIAGTQAAGLKAQFGTMCKPLHAGHAAATGAQAAALAAQGFTSRDNILEVEQGFVETQSAAPNAAKFAQGLNTQSFAQDICFKYHAACYMTHSAIEATDKLCQSNAFDPKQIKSVTVKVDPGHFRVCNIQAPSTGLEAKFSLRFTVAMTLAGVDTASIDIFTDALTEDPDLVAFRDLIEVVAHEHPNPNTVVCVTTQNGEVFEESCNVAVPQRDLDLQWQKLEHKFRALVSPRLGAERAAEIIDLCHRLDELEQLDPLFNALTKH